MRLRDRILLWLLPMMGMTVLLTTTVTTVRYAKEQEGYLTELQAIAAPAIADGVSDYLASVIQQGLTLEAPFAHGTPDLKKVEAAYVASNLSLSLEIWNGSGLVARLGDAKNALPVGPRLPELPDHPVLRDLAGTPTLIVPRRRLVFFFRLPTDWLKNQRRRFSAFDAALVDERAAIVSATRALSPADWKVWSGALSESKGTALVAREITREGSTKLITVVPVPELEGHRLLVLTPRQALSQRLMQSVAGMIPLLLGLGLLVAVSGYYFARRLVLPLEALTAATSQIAEGTWRVALPHDRSDEIGTLVRSFDRMGRELEERERQLRKSHEELARAERLATMGKFGAGIAHEVKNPLNSVLGYAQLLQKRDKLTDEKAGTYVKYILEETRRASHILTELLSFARRRAPVRAPVDLGALIQEVSARLVPTAQAAGVEIRVAPMPPAATADLDREQVAQVLHNLLLNAIQCFEGKSIAAPWIEMGLSSGRERWEITVRDNGPGIPPDVRNRIFEPFFSTKETGKGTGLGLSVSLGIAEAHGGTLVAEDNPNGGACFRLSLPMGAQAENESVGRQMVG